MPKRGPNWQCDGEALVGGVACIFGKRHSINLGTQASQANDEPSKSAFAIMQNPLAQDRVPLCAACRLPAPPLSNAIFMCILVALSLKAK